MKKYLCPLAISLFSLSGIFSQVNTFMSTLEYVPDLGPEYNTMLQTQNNGYLLCRSSADTAWGPQETWAEIIRTDITGNVAWAKRLRKGYLSGYHESSQSSVTELADGNFLFSAGEYDSLVRPQPCILKLDYAGNIMWSKRVATEEGGEIRCMKPAGDGGIILSGRAFNFSANQQYAFAIKTDSLGNYLWGFKTNLPSDSIAEFVSCVEIPGTGYAFLGNCTKSPIIVFTNLNGNIVWTKTLFNGASSGNSLGAIFLSSDNSIVVSGQCSKTNPYSKTMLLAKFDLSGNLLWAKRQLAPASPPPFTDSYATGIAEKNNTYYFAGYVANPIPATLVGAVSSSGNLLWTKQYYANYHPFNYEPLSFQKTSDGGFAFALLCGTTSPIFATAFVKTDANLEAGCGSTAYTMTLDTVNIQMATNVITSQTGSLISQTYSLTAFNPEQEFICENILDSTGVGINDPEFLNDEITLYPNPVSEKLFLKRKENNSSILKISVLDISGKLIYTSGLANEIIVSELNSGIYFLRIDLHDGSKHVIKFIKQ